MGSGKGTGRGFGSGFGLGRGRGYGYGRGFGQGAGGLSGYSCVKFVFFGFNVFFWLLGCAVLGVGIWLWVSRGAYVSLSPTFNFLSATALCVTAGILILVVGFFGCCGAIMESKCLLMTYFVLIVTIFILEVVTGALAFIYGTEIELVVGDELYKGIRKKYPSTTGPGQEEDDLRTFWATVQSTLKCCGVYNHTDWYKIAAWPEANRVPRECCLRNVTCAEENTKEDYYEYGCLKEIKDVLSEKLIVIGVVAISIVVIQILGLIASMALFCCLRQEKYYDE